MSGTELISTDDYDPNTLLDVVITVKDLINDCKSIYVGAWMY
jgi:hypothetical protein